MTQMTTVYLVKDDLEELKQFEYLLKKKRKKRYLGALREQTKRKLLVGSLFNGYVFNKLDQKKQLGKKVLSDSIYPFSGENNFYFGVGNSSYGHVLITSHSSVSVDIELYKDRNEAVYNTFLKINVVDDRNKKELFYRRWLEKECLEKMGESDIENTMKYLTFEEYIVGVYVPKKEEVKIIQIDFKNVADYYKGKSR